VEVIRDSASFGVRRVERLAQQCFALALPLAEAPRQSPRERDLHQLQDDERTERHRREAAPHPPTRGRHRGVAEVGLEQERLAARRADGQIYLQQFAVLTLEAVLRLRQVAGSGLNTPGVQRRPFVCFERVARADELGLIRIDDRACARPDLDAYEVVIEHRRSHDSVH
jgi:hypothetical protein